MSPEHRAALDEQLRAPIRAALEAGADKSEILYLLTRMLPELGDPLVIAGHIAAAYESFSAGMPR